jgi:glycosyltransferase involved in cell wall biosynthesis
VTSAASLPVSVIVPCHDAEATVERALESIANQTRPPAEAIVVDDASTDGTACVLRRCAESQWPFAFAVITLPRNRGPGEARNAGWAATHPATAYVAFLDADDIWLPRKLERQIEWMEKHPDVAWTSHRCSIPGSQRTWAIGDAAAPAVTAITPRRLLIRNAVATPTVVARASVRSRFREGWRHCEDLMLWLDWLDEGASGAMLDLPLASLGRVPGTAGGCTGDLAAMHRGEQRVIDALATEGRVSSVEAAAWRGYAWLRYQRRRLCG